MNILPFNCDTDFLDYITITVLFTPRVQRQNCMWCLMLLQRLHINDTLLMGPKLQQDILIVIALTANFKQIFRQIELYDPSKNVDNNRIASYP